MKIYLAGPCSATERPFMEEIATELRNFGYTVYCPFELKILNAWDYSQEDWSRMVFDKDVAAIDECDFMVMMSRGRESTAGTNWEQGYAYAKGKPIFVFQYTDATTSLMTYCGCNYFVGLPLAECAHCVGTFPYEAHIKRNERGTNKCLTVLT